MVFSSILKAVVRNQENGKISWEDSLFSNCEEHPNIYQ